MPETVVIIGSGPAAWTAAIYAARANLHPLVYEGAITAENQIKGTLPLGQLALTTEVENYPGLPSGDSREYLRSALPAERWPHWVEKNKPQPGHGIDGPEMMELMRQQAVNFKTRIITDDIVGVDLQKHPFVLTPLDGPVVESLALIIATGARCQLPGSAVRGSLQEQRRFRLCSLRRRSAAFPRQAFGGRGWRRLGDRRKHLLEQVRERSQPCAPPQRVTR